VEFVETRQARAEPRYVLRGWLVAATFDIAAWAAFALGAAGLVP